MWGCHGGLTLTRLGQVPELGAGALTCIGLLRFSPDAPLVHGYGAPFHRGSRTDVLTVR